jgi:hypothetical protein
LEQCLLGKSPEETGDLFLYTLEYRQPLPSKYHLKRLQTLEQWASDSSCILKRNGDMAAGVHLADEIYKLLDKLFQMASLHCPSLDLGSNNGNKSSQVPSPSEILSIHHDSINSTVFYEHSQHHE